MSLFEIMQKLLSHWSLTPLGISSTIQDLSLIDFCRGGRNILILYLSKSNNTTV